MENTSKVLHLKRMLPDAIREMLQTVELNDYTEAKEYAIKQAGVLLKEKGSKNATLVLNEDEEGKGDHKKVIFDAAPENGGYLHQQRAASLDGQGTS